MTTYKSRPGPYGKQRENGEIMSEELRGQLIQQDVVDKIYGLKGSHLLALVIFLVSGTAASTAFGLKAVIALDRLEVAITKQNCFNRYFLEAIHSREPYRGQCE